MTKPPNFLRPIAICILQKEGEIFVFEGYDSVKGETFYRPLGGSIEFTENSKQTVKREILEEIGKEITNISFIGVLENIFTHEGSPGHEIVMVYRAEFVDKNVYEQGEIIGVEDNGDEFKALWVPLDDFRSGKLILYPDGLLGIIE